MALVTTGRKIREQLDYQRSLKDAITEFKSLLSAEEKRMLAAVHAVHNSGTVLEFVADLDFKNKLKGGRGVAQRLHGVLESVLAFSAVVDTFVSSNPETAALVWGSVKMALQIAVNYTSYFEKLSEVFMGIRRLCPRLSDYRALFPDSVRLQNALCEFHAAIIRFCTQALRVLKRSKMAHMLKALQSFEAEFKPHIDKLRELSKDVREEVFLAKAHSDLQAQELGKKESEVASKHRWQLAHTFSRTGRELEDIKKLQEEQTLRESRMEKERLLKALSPLDLSAYHEACRKQHPGTTTWIQTTPAFVEWYKGANSSPLWCSGKIGSGKTIMSSSVVNYVLREKRDRGRMTFFFIQYDDSDSTKADTVIRSILRQCIDNAALYAEEEALLKDMFNGRFIGMEHWIRSLQQRIQTFGEFYLIIDGLDECKASERHILIDALASLVTQNSNLRLFLAGRPSVKLDLEKKFPSLQQISMLSEGQAQDIKLYIQSVVENRLSTAELVIQDDALLNGIVRTLSGHADGMFIWVFFLINEICAANNDDEVRQFLADLPPDLTATFTRALSRILSRQKKGALVQKIFTWVAAARRPLSLVELQDILSIDIGDEFSQAGKRVRDLSPIELWSENLLQVNEEDVMSVQFAHGTVRDFITTARLPLELSAFHVDINDADHFCGEMCVTYLHLNDFKTTIARRPQPLPPIHPTMIARIALRPHSKTAETITRLTHRRSASAPSIDVVGQLATYNRQTESRDEDVLSHDHPFLNYASINWIFHTNSFTKDKSRTYDKWTSLVAGKHDLAQVPQTWKGSSLDVVYWALSARHLALLRHTQDSVDSATFQELLEDSALSGDVNSVECLLEVRPFPESAIKQTFQAASQGGHIPVVDHLLGSGICQIALQLYGSDMIEVAMRHGQTWMVYHLLQLGANVNAILDSNGTTVLHEAARGGDWAIIRSLVAAGADIHGASGLNANEADHRSRRFTRAEGQQTEDVGKKAVKTNTVVGVAAEHGHLEIVENLLRYILLSADCPLWHTCLSDSLSDALYKATCKGFTRIVRNLVTYYDSLRMDSDVDFETAGRNSLIAAASRGHLDIVTTLLDGGLDANAVDSGSQSKDNSTALIAAAEWGHLPVVKLLLSKKADISFANRLGRTALMVASQEGRLDVVDHLIREGASVCDVDHDGETALTIAAHQGCFDVCLGLLRGGAEVDAANKDGRTALLAAASEGHLDVMHHLLDAGADPGNTDRSGKTALEIAAQEGHLSVVKLFFEPVPRISIHSKQRVMALSAASIHDRRDVTSYLMSLGSDRRQ